VAALITGLTSVGAVATGGVGLLAVGPIVAAFARGGPGARPRAGGGLIGLGSRNGGKYYDGRHRQGRGPPRVKADGERRERPGHLRGMQRESISRADWGWQSHSNRRSDP